MADLTTTTVRPDGQVAKPPAWLRIAGGNPHLAIVEGPPFFLGQREGKGFDKLSPNGCGIANRGAIGD
jgi:hypothetical protein